MSENEISITPIDSETALVRRPSDSGSRLRLSKRMHDITSAVRSLRFMHDSLKDGYRFDDETAQDKITYIGRSVAVLEREAELLKSLLEP